MSSAAQIEEPPTASKLRLIRRYLELTGLQRRIHTGSFLHRYAFPGGPMWSTESISEQSPITFRDAVARRIAALDRAYQRQRAAFQQEYERHLNWEFTEEELEEIVAFLARPVGQHYLEGSQRMSAYVGTNLEEIEEEIVREAIASISN